MISESSSIFWMMFWITWSKGDWLRSPHSYQLYWLPGPACIAFFLTFQREWPQNMVTLFWRVFQIPSAIIYSYFFLVCPGINEFTQLLVLIILLSTQMLLFKYKKAMAQVFVKDPWDHSFTYNCTTKLTRKMLRKSSLCALLKPVYLIYPDTLLLNPLCGKPSGLLKQLNLCCAVVRLTM